MAVRILNLFSDSNLVLGFYSGLRPSALPFMICFPDEHKYSTLVMRDIVCHLCNKEVWHEVDIGSFSRSDEMGRRVR
jgi:hypothetical protein